jgi:hypothetical protein
VQAFAVAHVGQAGHNVLTQRRRNRPKREHGNQAKEANANHDGFSLPELTSATDYIAVSSPDIAQNAGKNRHYLIGISSCDARGRGQSCSSPQLFKWRPLATFRGANDCGHGRTYLEVDDSI